jgi:WD40 repeat protein
VDTGKFDSMLASCSYDGRVIIWNGGSKPEEWAQTHTFAQHKSFVNSIAWAPHELGLCLVCGSSDGNILVFSARYDGGWDTTRVDQAHPVCETFVSWCPATTPGALISSGSSSQFEYVHKLASGGCDNTVKVWKLNNGSWRLNCFPVLQMHNDGMRDVAWAPNLGLPKSNIVSATLDGTVVIWTTAKEGEQWGGRVLYDFKTPVWKLSWLLTGNILTCESIAEFLLFSLECEFVLASVIEKMQKDPWLVAAAQHALRCTGAAFSVAANLLGVCIHAQVCPIPWPSFIMSVGSSVSWNVSWVWKPPWSLQPQAKHQFYTGYSTFRVSVRNGVSMSDGYALVLVDMFPRAQPVHELPP